VIISDGTVNGNVYGGYSYFDEATDNTVTISGSPVFGVSTTLFGGWSGSGSGAFTGNTLNIHSAGLTVAGLQNFQYLNFYLPTTVGNGGTILHVTGTANITGSTVNVGIDGFRSPLLAGDHVVLIDAGTLTGAPVNTTSHGQGMQGVTLLYDFDLATVGNQLLATVSGGPVPGQTIIIDRAISGDIYGNGVPPNGAPPPTSAPNNNTVRIGSGADVGAGKIYGGYGNISDTLGGYVTGNSVTVSGGSVGSNDIYSNVMYGGYVDGNGPHGADVTVNIIGNSVTISGGTVGSSIYGGYVNSYTPPVPMANIMGNSVTINGGTVSGNSIAGGSGGIGSIVTSNSVAISGGSVSASTIFGGSGSKVTGNSVTISGGSVNGMVAGGYSFIDSDTATATNNTVTISGNPIFGAGTALFGGWTSTGGSAFTGNTLNLHTAGLTVAGLQNFQYLNFYLPTTLGNGGTMLTVTGTANLTDGAGRSSTVNVGIDGASSPLRAGDRVVLIDAGTLIGAPVNTASRGQGMQGVTLLYDFDIATVGNQLLATVSGFNPGTNPDPGFGQIITVSGVANYNVYGNGAPANGYWAGMDPAELKNPSNNAIIVSSGTVNGMIVGGYGFSDSGPASASDNSVTISGGNINGTVYGGMSYSDAGPATATNNTVTISGNPIFGQLAGLYGGVAEGAGAGDAFTGNTLNLKTASLTVDALGGFQFLNFYLPTTLHADDTVLTVTGTAHIGNSTVNVGIGGASSPLRAGDTVILIDAGSLEGTLANSTASGLGMQGVTLQYDFGLAVIDNQLLATVAGIGPGGNGPRLNPQTKALSEGFVSGMTLVTQGADLIAGQGMMHAVNAARGVGNGTGLGAFGAVSGGWSRYDTGSHVDVSSISLMAGLSKRVDTQPGHLVFGAFFEYGNGTYDTYNSFSNAASVHGDGDIYHLGGGIIGRMDFADAGKGHFYTEASARAGNVQNEYSNNDLRDFQGRVAQYDSSSAYYGIHAGAGYVWKVADKTTLDLYGKYFWTGQQGDDVRLSTGETVSFDNVNSHRLRAGGRLAYAVAENIDLYGGAAYEHEFDGEAKARTNGYAISVPSLEGGTGIGELGLTLKPTKTMPVSLDLGVQGYAGQREGVTGSLQIRYDF